MKEHRDGEINKKWREKHRKEQERRRDWDCANKKMKYGFHSGSIYLCVCIGLDYAFASIHFFVGLAWGVCVLHCSAWMWSYFHWIISALLSLYQLFALSETDPQMLVCVFDLHIWLVNFVIQFVTHWHHHKQVQNTQNGALHLQSAQIMHIVEWQRCIGLWLPAALWRTWTNIVWQRAVKIVDVYVCVTGVSSAPWGCIWVLADVFWDIKSTIHK